MAENAELPKGRAGNGVAVVVVNFRTKELTVDAVESVLGDPLLEEVVVVDNGSGDESASFLRSVLRDPQVRIVESPENLGFGQGVNLGVAASHSPLLFLLNSDAVARTGTLDRLGRVLAGDVGVGVVAPAVYLADGRTLQADAYGPLPAPRALMRTNHRRRRRRSDRSDGAPGWVSGVAMMFRRDDFLAIGGFDPDFVMYLEDVDLCRRMQAAGKRIAREPSASVVHLGGRSGKARADRIDQLHRSKLVYLRKAGAGPLQLRCARVLRVVRLAVEALRARLAGRRA